MKNLLKTLAIVLAIGATVQAIQVYAQEKEVISIDEVEYNLTRLIELKHEMDANRSETGFVNRETTPDSDFPNIKTDADFKETFSTNVLRYIQVIGGQEAFKKVLSRPEFADVVSGHDPGI